MKSRVCMASGERLQRGFTLDQSGPHHRESTFWASGEYWSYMLGHERVLPIETWRCPQCGLLHNFAVDSAQAVSDAPAMFVGNNEAYCDRNDDSSVRHSVNTEVSAC